MCVSVRVFVQAADIPASLSKPGIPELAKLQSIGPPALCVSHPQSITVLHQLACHDVHQEKPRNNKLQQL
jgi:hypothetical protein